MDTNHYSDLPELLWVAIYSGGGSHNSAALRTLVHLIFQPGECTWWTRERSRHGYADAIRNLPE